MTFLHDKFSATPHREYSQTSGKLELLEERANVVKERVKSGKVVIQKNVRTRIINIPVELHEEYLSVQIAQGDEETQAFLAGDYDDKDVVARFDQTQGGHVTLNGRPLALGETVEIVLSREVAIVTKKTHAVEEVALHTFSETHTHTLATELRHEELHIEGEEFVKP